MPIIVEADTTTAGVLTPRAAGRLARSSPTRRACDALARRPRRVRRRARARPSTWRRDRRSPTGCGVTHPAVSVILIRHDLDTAVFAEALQLGHRRGRGRATTTSASARRSAAHAATWETSTARSATADGPRRPGDHRLLAQGWRRQDHDGGQPRRGALAARASGRLPRRPRPRLRRRRDHHAADPGAHHRRRGRSEEHLDFALLEPLLTRHRRARSRSWPRRRSPTPATGSRRRWCAA